MTALENLLATLIFEHPDKRIRIFDESIGMGHDSKLREITSVSEEKSIMLDDWCYVKSYDFDLFKSYCYGMTPIGEPVPNDEEIRKLYEDHPWEDIIYIEVR